MRQDKNCLVLSTTVSHCRHRHDKTVLFCLCRWCKRPIELAMSQTMCVGTEETSYKHSALSCKTDHYASRQQGVTKLTLNLNNSALKMANSSKINADDTCLLLVHTWLVVVSITTQRSVVPQHTCTVAVKLLLVNCGGESLTSSSSTVTSAVLVRAGTPESTATIFRLCTAT